MSTTALRHTVQWQGRSIAWDAFGQGQPVVFCHGTPWSSWLWQPFARALSASFTVYLWDMPGYGQSSKHAQHAVDLGVQGQALAFLLDHWQLDMPHVVAHDYGGAVSLRALLLHGARFRSLWLADVVVLRPWGSPFFRLVAERADVFTQLPAPIHRAAVQAYIQGAAHAPLAAQALDALTAPWVTPEGQAAFYRQIAQADEAFTAQIEPLLSRIELPVHIVWGEQDAWIPPDRADRLQACIAGASVEKIPQAGHLVQLDAPAALGISLQRWLAQQAHAAFA